MINLVLNVEPVPQGRPRFSRKGWAYTPEITRRFQRAVAFEAKALHPGERLDGPLRVGLTFYLKKPKSNKQAFPSLRPDLDNLVKAVADALNGVLWVDDAQIVDMVASKRWAKLGEPGQIIVEAWKTT